MYNKYAYELPSEHCFAWAKEVEIMQKENRIKDSEKAMLMKSLIASTRLTNEEVAEKIGVSVRMIYHYLSGRSEPCARVFLKLQGLAK